MHLARCFRGVSNGRQFELKGLSRLFDWAVDDYRWGAFAILAVRQTLFSRSVLDGAVRA